MAKGERKQKIKKGAPDCGLYVRIRGDFDPEQTMAKLRQLFFVTNASDYERNMHAVEIAPVADKDFADKAKALVDVIRANGFVAIIRDDADLAAKTGADGVLLELGKGKEVPAARALLGEDRIVGMRCGLFEDMGEEALERGADFVSFSFPDGALPPESTVKWWADLSDLPALVEGHVTNDNCIDYIRAGAMLLDSTDYIFGHPDGVMQGTVNMLYAIDLALEHRKAY